MLNLLETVRSQCAELDSAIVERHFRRLPTSYFEKYSAADQVRHLHLLAGLGFADLVDVDLRAIVSQAFEVTVVGVDHSGSLACITAALAAYGFDLEDVQVAPYLDADPDANGVVEQNYFVIVLRLSGTLRGRTVAEITAELRERLQLAFAHLSQGRLLEAQTVAADPRSASDLPAAERVPVVAGPRPSGYEALVLGGDFRVERKLAVGGMSEVYLATQLSLDRTAAIKLFRHEGSADDESLARFKQEALVLAQFSCAQIVQILAAGTNADPVRGVLGWMAMEYMAGGDLGHWLEEHGPPPAELAVRWFTEALEGLHYAHRRSILHRDLKPHNLLLTAEGHLKVSDFGLLKHAQELNADRLSQSGVVGTPQYMSPEQAMGDAIDERSDIFSLGTTFFYLLSGKLPFTKNTAAAVLVQITQQDAPRLCDVAPQVPLPLSVIIGRMMARQREQRYQDVGVVLEDLASYERRGLLSSIPTDSFVAAPAPVERPDVETQAYRPHMAPNDDLAL